MRVIGARLVLPRGSAVELILKWSSQQDSHSQAAGVHKERPGASFSICFLSSSDWPPLTMGAEQPVQGAEERQRWPGPKETGATVPSIPRLATHVRINSHAHRLLGRQCIMGRCIFCILPWWIITRAKNQSCTPTEGSVLLRPTWHDVLRDTCRRQEMK